MPDIVMMEATAVRRREGLRELSPEELRRLLDDLASKLPEVGSIHDDRGLGLTKASKENSDRPGSPVERNVSLFTGGKSQGVIEGDKDTMVATERLDAGDIRGAAQSARELYSTHGGTGNVTPAEAFAIRDELQSTTAGDIIRGPRGIESTRLAGAGDNVNRRLDTARAELETNPNTVDLEVNLEEARRDAEAARKRERDVVERLMSLRIPETEHGRIIEGLDSFRSTPIGQRIEGAGVTGTDVVSYANTAARDMSKDGGVDVKAAGILDETTKAVLEGRGNEHSDFMLKLLMTDIRVKRSPDLMRWIESLFSDREEPAVKTG